MLANESCSTWVADRTEYDHYCSKSFSPSQSYTYDDIHRILNWRQSFHATNIQPEYAICRERVSISRCFTRIEVLLRACARVSRAPWRDVIFFFFLSDVSALLKLRAHTTRKGISHDWITPILSRYRELFPTKSADISISLGHLPTSVWYLACSFYIFIHHPTHIH